MKLNLFVFVMICVLGNISAQAASEMEDRLIVPGERVGFITHNTTEEELKRLLPADQIKREAVNYGEPGPPIFYCHTRIFPDSGRELIIIWANSAIDGQVPHSFDAYHKEAEQKCNAMTLWQPQSITMFIDPSRAGYKEGSSLYWHTIDGIGLGSSLAQLEKANASPISWPITIVFPSAVNWNKGELSKGDCYNHADYVTPILTVYLDDSALPIDSNCSQPNVDTEECIKRYLKSYMEKDEINSKKLPTSLKDNIIINGIEVSLQKDAQCLSASQ